MAQIRGEILHNINVRNAKNGEQKFRQLYIATPITPEESDDSDDNESQITNVEENTAKNSENNNENENEPITKEGEECWNSIIMEWINSVEDKNRFDNTDDEIFLFSESDDLIWVDVCS